jgi:hypothetical protein
MDQIRVVALEKEIETHLAEHGARDWKLVRDRFAEVPHATFWRTVKAVRNRGTSSKDGQLRKCDEEMDLACLFPPCLEPMKKLAEYQSLLGDAEDLLNQSKGPGGKIKNWKMHARAIALRETVLRRQVQIMGDLTSLDMMACFFKATLDVLVKTDRSVTIEIMKKLNDLRELGEAGVYQAMQEAVAAIGK